MNLAGTLVWGEKRKNVIKTQVFQIHTYILIFTSDIYIVAKIKQKNLLHKSLPKEEKFCSKFFVLFLLQYIYRRQKLNNKYFPENFFQKIFIQCAYFFYKKKTGAFAPTFSFLMFSVAFLESLISEEKELPVAAG